MNDGLNDCVYDTGVILCSQIPCQATNAESRVGPTIDHVTLQ